MSTRRSLRVLILEDQPTDADLVLDELRQSGFEPEWQRVDSQSDYLANLHENLDLILADYSLPQFSALQALHGLQQRGLDIPFIVVTGSISEEVAVECMKQGAADYLLKDRLARLGPAVVKALEDKYIREKRRQAEEKLRQSEARYREFIEATPDLIFVKDDLFRYVMVNRANQEFFGKTEAEIIGKTDFDLMPEPIARVCQQTDKLALETQQVVIHIEQIKEQIFETRKFPVTLGKRMGVGGVIRNVTERKRMEETLRQSEQELARAQSIGQLGNWNWDIAGKSLTWSDELYHLFGVEKEHFALTYENIKNKIHPDDQAANSAMVIQLLDSGEQLAWEFRIIRPDGTVRWIHQMVEVARNSSGQPIRAFGIMQDITERKKAEEALRESERFARSTLDGLSAHIAILDEDGTILAVNRSWRVFADENPPVATNVNEGANYLAACDQASGPLSEGAAEFAAAIRAVLSGKLDRFEMEYSCHSPDEQRWFVGRVTRFPGEGPVRVVVAHENTTQTKLAELKLAEERNLLRTLIDNLPDHIYVKDMQGRFTIRNEAGARHMGAATTDEAVGKTDFDYYPPELAAQYCADDQTVLQSGQPLLNREEPITAADGTQGWILTSKVPLRDDRGNVIGLVGMGHDITRRKRVEEDLRKLSHAVEHSPNIIYITDSEGRIEYVNPKFTEVTGYTAEEAMGRIPRLLDPNKISREEYVERWNTILSGNEWRGEFHNRKKNGEQFWESVAISSVKNAGGSHAHFVLVMEDITERKRAEAAERDQRILAEALRDTAAALTSALNLDAVMNSILENVARVVPHDAANIMLIENDQARVVYWHDYPPDQIPLLEEARFSVSNTPNLHQIIETGSPVLTSYTDQRSDWMHQPFTEWVKSHVGVPIRSRHQVVGILNLDSSIPGFFTKNHAQRLQAFADQASIAIEHAQLYEEIHRHADELSQRVEERTTQLNYAKERVEAILNSSSDVMILCRIDSTIDQVNPAFDAKFRYLPDEICRQPLSALVISEHVSLLEQTFETVVQTREPQRLEVTFQDKASSAFEGEMMLSPVVGPNRQLFGVICSLRDITERKRMEVQLRQMLEHEMELGELKTRYVSMAAHDLRNPLAAIRMAVELIQKHQNRMTEEQKRAKYDNILRSITVMAELLDDILTIGQAESGKLQFEPERLDLLTFSQELVTELEQTSSGTQRIRFAHQGVCTMVHLDAKLLRYILGNLLSNAIKYSPTQSTVTFELQCESDAVTFRIQDQGIGIPKADQARMFEAFHRAGNVNRTPGTGLGLAIVKRSVDLHGGTITFESQEGVGTTFTVILPQTPIEKREPHEKSVDDRG